MSRPALLCVLLLSSCAEPAGESGARAPTPAGPGGGGGGGDIEVLGILVTPDDLVLPTGESAQLRVTGLLAEHESVDLTSSVQWSVVDAGVVAVSDALDQEGQVDALGTGITQVVATYGDVQSPAVRVQVTDATLDRLVVSPTRVDLAAGESVELSASATFSDGSTGDFTSQVRWVTEDASVARFGDGARLDAAEPGETVVRASFEGQDSDGVPVTVVAAPGPNLLVSAASGSISGGILDLDVTVRNDGSTGAAEFWVDVFVDPGGAPAVGDIGEDYALVPYAGADDTVSLQFQIPVTQSDHDVVVFVDTNDDIEENAEGDNQLAATLSAGNTASGPDLAVTFFDYYADGYSVYWLVDVTNLGDEDAGWFFVDLFTDRSTAPALYEDGDAYSSIDSLAAGDTDWADFELDLSCSPCATWVMVDGYDSVDESDEGNNVEGPLAVWSD